MGSTISDERAITNQLGEFARIIDGKHWSRVSEVFADDLTFNYGDGQEQAGGAALLVNFRKYLDNCGPTQHLLGSVQIELDGDRALSRAYVQARHQGKGAREHLFLDTNGEYVDCWERRPEGWRIVRRDASFNLFTGDWSVLAP